MDACPEAGVWLAAPLDLADIDADFGDQVVDVDHVEWDEKHGVRASRERRLGSLVLSRSTVRDPDPSLVASAVAEGIRRHGLEVFHWSEGAQRLRQRIAFLHANDPSWPDMSDSPLMTSLLDRLHDELSQVRSARALQDVDVSAALLAMLNWEQRRRLDQLAPTHYEAPTGSRLPIDYTDSSSPTVSVRLQELFGTR